MSELEHPAETITRLGLRGKRVTLAVAVNLDPVPGWGNTAEDYRAFKKRLVDEGIAHAALVYDGDLAVAWAEYGTPAELPGIHHRKEYLATAERLPDYRITCIQVEKVHRGKGLASVALRGAVDLIAQAGGGVVGSGSTIGRPVLWLGPPGLIPRS